MLCLIFFKVWVKTGSTRSYLTVTVSQRSNWKESFGGRWGQHRLESFTSLSLSIHLSSWSSWDHVCTCTNGLPWNVKGFHDTCGTGRRWIDSEVTWCYMNTCCSPLTASDSWGITWRWLLWPSVPLPPFWTNTEQGMKSIVQVGTESVLQLPIVNRNLRSLWQNPWSPPS